MTAGLGDFPGPVPAGLPDEATLTRMAAEFFGALGGTSGAVPSGAVPSGAVPPGSVPAEAPSEVNAMEPTPAALDTPSAPGLPSPPRLDPPGAAGGASTTGAAQYAAAPLAHGEFTPPWLSPVPPPGEAVPAGGPALPGSAMASAPPPATRPGTTGGSTTGGTQYADSAGHQQGNPFGDTTVTAPGLPDIPSLAALAALALGQPAPAPTSAAEPQTPAAPGSTTFPAPELSDGRAPNSRTGDGRPHAAESAPEYSSAFGADPFGATDVVVPQLPEIPALAALATPTLPEAPAGSPPISAPSTPYSFLGEAAGYPSAGGALPAYTAPRPEGGRPLPHPGHGEFDVEAVRRDFPILSETVNGRPLVWFDNAATTQKPQAVIDRLAYFYAHENSNIHRAAHELAARSTDAYEGARDKVARFLGASSSDEIVFVRGATEAINLVAAAWGRKHIGAGDEIVISHLEHHANIVPWQELAKQTGAVLKVIPVDSDGQILMDRYTDLLSDRTKLVSITQVSNALGTVVPVQEVAELAHRAGAKVLVDGAQSVPHLRVNVQDLGADFFAFSGHKIFAPTGVGALYVRDDVAEEMGVYQTGGNMIRDVTLERSLFHHAPMKFEAGTGTIADAVGLGAALDYLERIGFENAAAYEHSLLEYGMRLLKDVPGLTLIGTAPDKASVMSFVLDGYSPEQVGSALNAEGIAVRSGHHCAQPILRRYGLEATVRPSLAFYNTCAEIDHLVTVLHRLAADGGGASRRGQGTTDPAP
ncbi:family 2A encapsulin nanocompartment cargo protein cysteine desulfurase [Sporichthya brevicatena]|uniref:cysteine desulfurase n=1 Tax=Sporichthya brevicatena TaxID=171442 RepID=A0ABN1GLB1_9ACTN